MALNQAKDLDRDIASLAVQIDMLSSAKDRARRDREQMCSLGFDGDDPALERNLQLLNSLDRTINAEKKKLEPLLYERARCKEQ